MIDQKQAYSVILQEDELPKRKPAFSNRRTDVNNASQLLDQTEIMRFNNNRNFEKFQENIKSKKAGSSTALDES
jgi:hypothetical protein